MDSHLRDHMHPAVSRLNHVELLSNQTVTFLELKPTNPTPSRVISSNEIKTMSILESTVKYKDQNETPNRQLVGYNYIT
jgi:hypothetical protein